MRHLWATMLRWLNRRRASSGERRLAREVGRLEAALDEARAEAETRVEAAETRAREAVAEADAAVMERKVLSTAVERIRSHYEADISAAAKRIAEGGKP